VPAGYSPLVGLLKIMSNAATYKLNFYAFIWHALFLAFAATFIDVNTVLSSFVLNIGGSSVHVGILTGIYIGLPLITQLFFAGFLAGRSRKKPFLLVGIYLRVLALTGMGYTLSISSSSDPGRILFMIFLWIGIFALSGAFAGISCTDLLGKIFVGPRRKNLLIFKQFISFGFIIIASLLPMVTLLLSRYEIAVYQWIFFIAGFSTSAYAISVQGILLEITNNDNRAIYAGISGTLCLTTAIFPLIAGTLIESYGFTLIFTIISPLVMTSLFFLKPIKCSTP
jgi:hypothetical protein